MVFQLRQWRIQYMKKTFISLALAVLLAGCATKPTNQEMASADYGPYPGGYEQIIKSYMQSVLKDPDSARYRFKNSPTKAWDGTGGTKYGYVVCVLINSKNSFGGYVGDRMTYFIINNDRVTYVYRADGTYRDDIAEAKCKKFIPLT
jgi:hypothetical protein